MTEWWIPVPIKQKQGQDLANTEEKTKPVY